MELQCYHSNSQSSISWPSLTNPIHQDPDQSQVCRIWQGQQRQNSSGHLENPMFCRYSTAGLAGDNSPFSETQHSRSSPKKQIVIPKPNRVCAQHSGQVSQHRATDYWGHCSLIRRDENGLTTLPSFVSHNINNLHAVSDKTSGLSLNTYRKSLEISVPPRKKLKGSAVNDEVDNTSAFRVFKRDENNQQLKRITERIKNLPPPPPLVKANKICDFSSRSDDRSREVIVICDSPPAFSRSDLVQSDYQHPLRATEHSETISRETLLHSKPITSTRANTLEHQIQFVASKMYKSRDERISTETKCDGNYKNCHNLPVRSPLSSPKDAYSLNNRSALSQFSNSRRFTRIHHNTTPFGNKQKTTTLQYVPHPGIHGQLVDYYPDSIHNDVLFSSTKKSSRPHIKNRSKNHKMIDPGRPSSRASFISDTQEAIQAWKLQSQLAELSNSQMNNPLALPDLLRNITKVPNREISPRKEPRLCKDPSHCSANKHKHTANHGLSEFSTTNNNELQSFATQRGKESPNKAEPRIEIPKLSKHRRHMKDESVRTTQRSPQLHSNYPNGIQKPSRCPYVVVPDSQRATHALKQQSMRSLLSSSSQRTSSSVLTESTRNRTTMSAKVAESVVPPLRGYLSSQSSISHSSPKENCSNFIENSQFVMSNRDSLPFLHNKYKEKASKKEKIQSANSSESKFSSGPSNNDHPPLLDNEKMVKENKKQLTTSSQLTESSNSHNLDLLPFLDNDDKVSKEVKNQTSMPPQLTIARSPHGVPLVSEDRQASPMQKNNPAMFRSPPQPRRLTYPMDNNHTNGKDLKLSQYNGNHKSISPNAPLRRTVSESEEKLSCDNEVSPLVKTFEISEGNSPQPCGGYAYDHDSMPIIVAVHSILMDDETSKVQGMKSGQADERKIEISENTSVSTPPQCISDIQSTSNEQNDHQRPILPKPPTNEHKCHSKVDFSHGNQNVTSQTSLSTIETKEKEPQSHPASRSCDIENKPTSLQTSFSVNVEKSSSNDDALVGELDKAIQTDTNPVNYNMEKGENSSSNWSKTTIARQEEAEKVAKIPKSPSHRRQSVEELCSKIVETRERIEKEEIDWKKRFLRRLEHVLIKKLKKAERDTGEKASIELPPEKNAKSKDEQKNKVKNSKRNKSSSDETGTKMEQTEKETKEKSEDPAQKTDQTKHADDKQNTLKANENSAKKRKQSHSRSDLPVAICNNDENMSTLDKITDKEPLDSKESYTGDITLKISEMIPNKDDIKMDRKTTMDDIKDNEVTKEIVEATVDTLLSPESALEDEAFDNNEEPGYCDLVIVE